MDQKKPTQIRAQKKVYPSVFEKSAWVVDNETMRDLEGGKIRRRHQDQTVILTFTEEPKRWGTLLSKVIEATKDGGQIYFPPKMSDGFLIVNALAKKGQNREGFWYVLVQH